jgi:hypothetical protein
VAVPCALRLAMALLHAVDAVGARRRFVTSCEYVEEIKP